MNIMKFACEIYGGVLVKYYAVCKKMNQRVNDFLETWHCLVGHSL